MEPIIESVTNFGLAVGLCLAFVWFFYKTFVWMREDAKEREQRILLAAEDREKYSRERAQRDREQIEHFSQIIATNSNALLENAKVMEKINSNIEDISDNVHNLQKDVTEIKYRQVHRDEKR